MNYVLDIILIVLIGISAFFAYRAGLIKSLFSLVGGVGALALAVAIFDSVSVPLCEILFFKMNILLARISAFLLVIVVCYLVLFIISRLLDTVFRVLPFGKSINRAGGMILGVARGALLVLIFGAVAYQLAMAEIWIQPDDLENTFLLQRINEINPIIDVLK